MAPPSSTLAWTIPWTEEPGRLWSMGSLRVGQDGATSLSLFTFMHWRRKWKPTPVLFPGESQGRGSLVDCCLWGHTESDTTEATQQQQQQKLLCGGFPGGSGKRICLQSRRPGWGRSPGGGHGNPRQYFCLQNPQGQQSLVGCLLCCCTELDTTEAT